MNSTSLLKERIQQLEYQQTEALSEIKLEFSNIYESVKPMNIIKNTLESSLNMPEIKDKLIDSLLGLATGFVTKKILVKNGDTAMGKVLGTVVQFAVAALVAKNSDKLKEVSRNILQYGLNLIENHDEVTPSEEK
ncbi:MAG: hypothetical protein IPL09_09070 [Bacteroidetes bacterium]|mgnify:FL=1|jgi:hypothetical protein|nr:hypothetical protein [Bacteroidota bacterium]HMT34317.1 hypothetical protein [Chitinophagaceae bacterium]MBK6820616.1 hypothetical protein [Bacteroidota bacterium]MBK7040878.1 hypothetical protein [Bacteroidota bacterium]MBK7589233.1 hypothetical protein [Bacteroidota bacterium]